MAADKINNAIVQFSYRCQIFCQRYDSGPESIEAMNRRGSNAFQPLQKPIIDDVTMSLARLTDNASVGSNANASLPHLLDQSAPYLAQGNLSRLQNLLAQLVLDFLRIRKRRNKAMVHSDLQSVLQPERLPPLIYDELKSAMNRCRSINHLNALRAEQARARKSRLAEKRRHEKDLENVITAIKNGIDARLVKGPLEQVSARLEELETLIAPTKGSEPPKPLVHPAVAQRYRLEVKNQKGAGTQGRAGR